MAARSLPERPHIDQYRRQAKELLRALAAGSPDAIARARDWLPNPPDASAVPARLADAQLILAREHGFASWPRFRAQVMQLSGASRATMPTHLRCEAGDLGVGVRFAEAAKGVVLFSLAGNVGRGHLGVQQIANRMVGAGYHVVMADLLTDAEAIEDALHEELRHDLDLLERRLALAFDWMAAHAVFSGLRFALYGAGSGGAAAVRLAAARGDAIASLVCAAGRPDLAGSCLWRIRAQTLFVVGSEDAVGHGFTRMAQTILPRTLASELAILPGAGLRFEEGPIAALAAQRAIEWFDTHLAMRHAVEEACP